MLTFIFRIGHSPTDTRRKRQLKSVFSLVMIGTLLVDLDFLILRERTILERFIDSWIMAASFVGLLALHVTKRHDFAFIWFLSMMIPAVVALLLVTGNGHGDLAVFAVAPVWAVAMLGARRSIPWFVACVLAAVCALAVGPFLPYIPTDVHQSAENPMGWLFHQPQKEWVSRDEAITFVACIVLIYIMMYTAHRALSEANRRIEDLLINVMPPSIAARLTEEDEQKIRSEGATIADAYEEATILFADIVGFTQLAEKMSSSELVTLLDRVFAKFDDLAGKHRVEKIKTIGDAYMAVSGLPDRDTNHAENVVEMALAMIKTVRDFRKQTGIPLRIRIGINTGPVVAGIIGRKRFLYDLWGDAVNTASRMESHAEADTIQASVGTYEVLKNEYEFLPLGALEVKGKGCLRAWRLIGKRAVASS